MRQLLCVVALVLTAGFARAQGDYIIDSLQRKLAAANTATDKVYFMGMLARLCMNTNRAQADEWGSKMMREAELSRDRRLIIRAHFSNGERFSYFQQARDQTEKAIGYFDEALRLARQNKFDKEQAQALVYLTSAHLNLYNYDRAHGYVTQAYSLANSIGDDSLKVVANVAFGNYYLARKERLLALRSYLDGLRIAEMGKAERAAVLKRTCYSNLSRFYAGIEEYDKAIDYAQLAIDQLALMKVGGEVYRRVQDYYNLGMLYAYKKDFNMSVYHFDRCIALADSLKNGSLKTLGYNGLLNQYLQSGQPQKALELFNERKELKQFIVNAGMPEVIDQAYGIIYSELRQFDSANFYFARAADRFDRVGTPATRIGFFYQYGYHLKKSGDRAGAIERFQKAHALADTAKNIEWLQNTAKELDTLYAQSGNYALSNQYKSDYHRYKDSVQKLGEEKDLLQVELADEQQRQARIERQHAEEQERQHTLQYMAITVAIAGAFVLLVLLGFFQVSATVIRVLGFFSFIFFFEFLILIADNKIHHWTHGEPLKVLGIKVLLIAALLPLHHWLEHKVVHYLASRKLHEDVGKVGLTRFLRKKKPQAEA
ncbi:MAG: hypothetical protein EOO08_08160 [Chitinophagaceae bacterium]|nr:MAG: hypothetical protein EOO08_08160 [Chitinophagaceae bacterium]